MRVAGLTATIAFGLGLLLLMSGNLRSDSCDCRHCFPGTCPTGTNDCGPKGKAYCPAGGVPLCTTPDGCCSDADCTGGGQCVVGKCVCPTGKTLCGGQCVDTRINLNNCGVCGNACSPLDKCCAGVCVSCPIRGECVGDQLKCACPPDRPSICVLGGTSLAACFNLKTGDQGTGFCGSCAIICPEGQDCCNGACQNLQDDPANCGQCGLLCATAPGGNPACCHGNCVDLNHDAANCGHCRRGCGPAQRCINGACEGGPPCQGGGRCDPSCTCPLPGQTCVRGFCSLPE